MGLSPQQTSTLAKRALAFSVGLFASFFVALGLLSLWGILALWRLIDKCQGQGHDCPALLHGFFKLEIAVLLGMISYGCLIVVPVSILSEIFHQKVTLPRQIGRAHV